MTEVVKLRAGESLPEHGNHLVITRIGRVRGFDYYIDGSPAVEGRIGPRVPSGGPGYASLETALKAAEALAEQHGVDTIYIQPDTVLIRPFYPGVIQPP